jgi:hypothetical protein
MGVSWQMRRSRLRALVPCIAVCAAFVVSACGNAESASSSRAVSVRLRGGPPNASVTVDDLLIGPLDVVQARGFAVAPGKHHVSVEANGYFPRDVVVDARPEGPDAKRPVIVDVGLTPIPD